MANEMSTRKVLTDFLYMQGPYWLFLQTFQRLAEFM